MTNPRSVSNSRSLRRESRSDGISKPPKYVLARTYAEVQEYARIHRIHITSLHFIDGPHRIRQEIPEGKRFDLVKTGTWFLIDKPVLEEILFELKMREDWTG